MVDYVTIVEMRILKITGECFYPNYLLFTKLTRSERWKGETEAESHLHVLGSGNADLKLWKELLKWLPSSFSL